MLGGVLDLPVWGYVAAALLLTHVTIAAVTIFLHRHQAHRALDLHPIASHFFRFWLWLTTGMVTKEWVAIHRKHHARVEGPEDPHSPQQAGIRKVLLEGTELYRAESKNAETLARFGHGTPDDWIERHVYTPHSGKGYYLMMAANLVLFGPIGLTIWAVQMLWIPFFAAGVINGVGHWWGYRNYETADASANIVPWGIVIGGEELHNNHHAFASSAKLSARWWEFDIGWLYIRVLASLGLARVKKLAPKPVFDPAKSRVDVDTVSAVITHRMTVMSHYARTVLVPVLKEELAAADASRRRALKRARAVLVREESLLTAESRFRLDSALRLSEALETAYRYKMQLQAIWQDRHASQERLSQRLQEWCRHAEASGIRALQDFARMIPQYSLQPTAA